MAECTGVQCSLTHSEESKEWPEATISTRMTMNPYLLAKAREECFKHGVNTWEYLNVALWEKLGRPTHDELMEFAANMEVDEEDPKWVKRLKITAAHEMEMLRIKHERRQQSGNGDAQPAKAE